MKSAWIGFICIAVGVAALVSCHRIRPKAPEATRLDSTLALPLSTLVIPVHYKTAELQRVINQELAGTFIHERTLLDNAGDSLFIQVTKQGEITLDWHPPVLSYSVPIRVSAFFIKRIAGVKVRNSTPIEADVIIRMHTVLALQPSWNVRASTTLEEIRWLKDPKLNFAGLKVNLRKLIESRLKKNEAQLTAKVDNALQDVIRSRKTIGNLWMSIQRPIRINKRGLEVWLKPRPVDITARFVDRPGWIALQVNLKAEVRTMMDGDTLPPDNLMLPSFRHEALQSDSIEMYIHGRLSYRHINNVLNEQLKGRRIEHDHYEAVVKSVSVYGTDEGLAIRLDVEGSVHGRLYLRAGIGYDYDSVRLYATQFDYDVDTESRLVQTADWLMHTQSLELIKARLSLDLKPYLDVLPSLVTRAVERGKLGTKMDLNITDLQLEPVHYLITRTDIQVLFRAKGKAGIRLEDGIFARRKGEAGDKQNP